MWIYVIYIYDYMYVGIFTISTNEQYSRDTPITQDICVSMCGWPLSRTPGCEAIPWPGQAVWDALNFSDGGWTVAMISMWNFLELTKQSAIHVSAWEQTQTTTTNKPQMGFDHCQKVGTPKLALKMHEQNPTVRHEFFLNKGVNFSAVVRDTLLIIILLASSTAKSGGRSFQNKKPVL